MLVPRLWNFEELHPIKDKHGALAAILRFEGDSLLLVRVQDGIEIVCGRRDLQVKERQL